MRYAFITNLVVGWVAAATPAGAAAAAAAQRRIVQKLAAEVASPDGKSALGRLTV